MKRFLITVTALLAALFCSAEPQSSPYKSFRCSREVINAVYSMAQEPAACLTDSLDLPLLMEYRWQRFGDRDYVAAHFQDMLLLLDSFVLDSAGLVSAPVFVDEYRPVEQKPEAYEQLENLAPALRDNVQLAAAAKPVVVHPVSTDPQLVSTALYYKYLMLAARFAAMLGVPAQDYEARAAAVAASFNARFLHVERGTSLQPGHMLYPDDVYYGDNTPSANVLALAFGLVPDDCRADVEQNLVSGLIRRYRSNPAVGRYGALYLYETLGRIGRGDVAEAMFEGMKIVKWDRLTKHHEVIYLDCPRTLGYRFDPSLSGDMVDWLYAGVGGIHVGDMDSTGVRLSVDCSIDALDWAEAVYDHPCGQISSSWHKTLSRLDWDIEVPEGVEAEVCLPTVHRRHVRGRRGMKLLRRGNGCSVWRVKPGQRHLSVAIDMPEYVEDKSFVFTEAPFIHTHTATIAETRKGDLVVAYFGGTSENHPDCDIYVSRKPAGSDVWTEPVKVSDGIVDGEEYTTCLSVLYQLPEETGRDELWLFYMTKPSLEFQGWWMKSFDGGVTWTEPVPMPEGFQGPIKNKPVYNQGRIICPSSTQSSREWSSHFEYTDDLGETWHKSAPASREWAITALNRAPGKVGENWMTPRDGHTVGEVLEVVTSIQPSILVHPDGVLQALSRSRHGRLACVWSTDNGTTWGREYLSDLGNNVSGFDAVTLRDGRFVRVFNDFEALPGGGSERNPLTIAISSDGIKWTKLLDIDDTPTGNLGYPSIIEGRDGYIHVVYTWKRERIKYVKLKPVR